MKHTKDSLKRALQDFSRTHNRAPSGNDHKTYPELPNVKVFVYHFGSWNNALKFAGLETFQPESKTCSVACPSCGREQQMAKKEYYYSLKKKHFCSSNCKQQYVQTQQQSRRSKLEQQIEKMLKTDFPDLSIVFNDRITIGYELDILVLDLRLAFELNGPVHYEPIHGSDAFERVQRNDEHKMVLCREQGIELAVVDTSTYTYSQKSTNRFYLIVKENIERVIGRLPSV